MRAVAARMSEARVRAPGRAGVYFWRRGTARGGALVVNAEVVESDLARLTPAGFAERFSGAPVAVTGDASQWTGTVFAVTGRPAMIIAHTIKGKGVSFMEGDYNWHAKVPNKDELAKALAELEAQRPRA